MLNAVSIRSVFPKPIGVKALEQRAGNGIFSAKNFTEAKEVCVSNKVAMDQNASRTPRA